MRIADLPSTGTDRFAVPALNGKVGRLLSVGAGCAVIQWEAEQRTKTFTARRRDHTTGLMVEKQVTVPDRDRPGPVTLALDVVPLSPSH